MPIDASAQNSLKGGKRTTMTEMLSRIAALACALVLLAGCGLKGDLYIPEAEPSAAQTPSSDTSVSPEYVDEENDQEIADD